MPDSAPPPLGRRRFLGCIGCIACIGRFGSLIGLGTAAAPAVLRAEGTPVAPYPAHAIRVVVPFSAGGTTDIVSRVLGERLSSSMGQAVIVENRPGAGSTLGAAEVARSAADGYTLLTITPTHLLGPALYKKLGYDPLAGFAPVARLASGPFVLAVPAGSRAATVKELVAMARASPGSLNYGSSGNGSGQHLAGHLFERSAAIALMHVPYKGSAQVTTDLIAGSLQLAFMGLPNALPHIRSGRLRALAVTGASRWADLPEIPTMKQAGVAAYEIESWVALVAPAGTPAGVVARLRNEIGKGFQSAAVRQTLIAAGAEVSVSRPDALAGFLRDESRRWLELARSSGITAE